MAHVAFVTHYSHRPLRKLNNRQSFGSIQNFSPLFVGDCLLGPVRNTGARRDLRVKPSAPVCNLSQ